MFRAIFYYDFVIKLKVWRPSYASCHGHNTRCTAIVILCVRWPPYNAQNFIKS